MIGNRHSGDSIASEFLKIMGHSPPEVSGGAHPVGSDGVKKSASVDDSYLRDAAADMLEDAPEGSGADPVESNMEQAIASVENMLTEDGGYYDIGDNADDADDADDADNASLSGDWNASNDLEEPEGSLDRGSVVSASDEYLIKGLGKIAKGLRGKSESFAADMVEATARSIYKDIQKESSYKNSVVNNLLKISKELSTSGDSFASDLVQVTMDKIRKG